MYPMGVTKFLFNVWQKIMVEHLRAYWG